MSTAGTKPGGKKTGGRTKGTPNKKTVQKLNELSDRASEIVRSKEKRGIEVLNELMKTAMSFAAMEQRKLLEYQGGIDMAPQQMRDRFWKAMECAGVFAKELARYQDPTFKAIAVIPPPPPPRDPAPGDGAKTIEGKAVRLDDPVAVARIYQQMVRIVR